LGANEAEGYGGFAAAAVAADGYCYFVRFVHCVRDAGDAGGGVVWLWVEGCGVI
jgi:hypothetical protein